MTITAEEIQSLPESDRLALAALLAPRMVDPYVPHVPHPPQIAYLLQDGPEAFYGGAAGGGKSDALLMAAGQYLDVPGYSALILRRTFGDLTLPGAIMDRADSWFAPTPARKRGGKTWEFPTKDPANPARITFGYLMYHKDVEQYRGAEFQFIGIDELTQFQERTYRFLFSRMRGPSLNCIECGYPASKLPGVPWLHDEGHPDDVDCGRMWVPPSTGPLSELFTEGELYTTANPDRSARQDGSPMIGAPDGLTLADVPLRMRSASNPGGVGHAWVRDRFVSPTKKAEGALFIPAKIGDNPSLDRRAYRASMSHLDALERRRLETGDWDAADEGEVFERGWFKVVSEAPAGLEMVRAWDLAATAQSKKNRDPDWTVGVLLGIDRTAGRWTILDVMRFRKNPADVEAIVTTTASADRAMWGCKTIRMNQDPGAAGKNTIHTYRRLLAGYDFDGFIESGSKEERARPSASALAAGNMDLLDGAWNSTFIDELAAFPSDGVHDDQVDALSTAVASLAFGRSARLIA